MLLFLFVTACTTAHHDSADTADTAGGSDTDWTQETALSSDGGAYYLMYSATPEPIPFNEPFSMYWMVHDGADHNTMFTDAELALEVSMPEHGHGMNTVPTITRDAMGGFQVEGMLFHMRGWWDIKATATRGGLSEGATFYVECCEG